MVSEKIYRTGSKELRENLPKGFDRMASEKTPLSQGQIQRVISGKAMDDTGFMVAVEQIAKDYKEFYNRMQTLLENYNEKQINENREKETNANRKESG